MNAGWMMALGLLAAVSMVFGNLAALAQASVKRLLAYSAIAHAGYMLLAILANSPLGISGLLYYVLVYGLATMGAFVVVSVVEQKIGGDRLTDFVGLSRRAPILSLCLLVFLLSLAGIPPLAGFFGKFYVFVAAADAGAGGLGLLWLVILAVATSVVSLYYYLMVLKQVYVRTAPPDSAPFKGTLGVGLCASLLALAVLLLGCFPSLVLHLIESAVVGVH